MIQIMLLCDTNDACTGLYAVCSILEKGSNFMLKKSCDMKRVLFALVMVLTISMSCRNECHDVPEEAAVMRQEILDDLTRNILPFWINYSYDPTGGFYGVVGRDGTGHPDAPKGGVMVARILWTFSTAYELYGDVHYRLVADRAQRDFLSTFVDREHGGVYWQVNPDGTPYDSSKQTYAMTYGIYGLVAHYRATGERSSLDAAVELYRTLEDKVREKEKDGYIEAFNADFTVARGDRFAPGKESFKTMNTHIHIVEAYTQLYKVWPDKGLGERLKASILIVTDKIYDAETCHLGPFFDNSWNPMGSIDSYGHDIETAWLLTEASAVYGDKALIDKCRGISIDIVDTAIAEGFNQEKGYMMYEVRNGVLNDYAKWWPQCETIIGCVDAWQLTGDESYLDVAYRTWDFIKMNLIDKEHGEWFRGVSADGRPNAREAKASVWNCPYHNSRLGFEMDLRLR